MSNMTLREVVNAFQAQDPAIIDSLIKASGVLQTALFQPASHNVYHMSKKVNALPSGTFIAPGGSVTDSTVDTDIIQTNLQLARIIQSEPKELVDSYPNGKKAYFQAISQAVYEGLGQTIAKQLIYGTTSLGDVSGFKGFHQIAKTNSKVIQASGASGSSTSIIAVRWKRDLCSILFNPGLLTQGKFVEISVLHGGKPTTEVTNTTTGAKKLVYQVAYDSYLSLLAPDSKNVAAYTQLDSTHKPTAANTDKLVDYVNGSSADTFLYVSRTGRRYLWELKNSKMQTFTTDNNYNDTIELWNGIPVILDESILDTETDVID